MVDTPHALLVDDDDVVVVVDDPAVSGTSIDPSLES